MAPAKIQSSYQIILHECKDGLNIGSVARAMKNFGFDRLTLSAPRDGDLERVATTARRAVDLVENAATSPDLKSALSNCHYVAGFSTKDSKNTPPVLSLREWAVELPELERSDSSIGLLFGPEDTGLRYEHLPYCNVIVRIPSSDEYDSLNLAQAVMLTLYEIVASRGAVRTDAHEEELAVGKQYAVLDALLEEIGRHTSFTNEGTPDDVVGLLKHLFRRPQITHREMQILLGFFSRFSKTY